MNGTQGFQGCPGQRGVKVKALILTSTFKKHIFSLKLSILFLYLFNVMMKHDCFLLLRAHVGTQERR